MRSRKSELTRSHFGEGEATVFLSKEISSLKRSFVLRSIYGNRVDCETLTRPEFADHRIARYMGNCTCPQCIVQYYHIIYARSAILYTGFFLADESAVFHFEKFRGGLHKRQVLRNADVDRLSAVATPHTQPEIANSSTTFISPNLFSILLSILFLLSRYVIVY